MHKNREREREVERLRERADIFNMWQESNGLDSTCCDDILDNLGKTLKLQDVEDRFAPDDEFDTGDLDDDIDPAMKEKIDR